MPDTEHPSRGASASLQGSLCSLWGQKAVLQGSTAAQALPGAPSCARAGVWSCGVGRQPFRADSSPAAPLGSRHMPLPARRALQKCDACCSSGTCSSCPTLFFPFWIVFL